MGCDSIISRTKALLGENDERGRIREPFLTRQEWSSLDRIKSNQNHAALTLPISEDSTPTHIPCRRPASPVQLPSLLFLLLVANGPRLDRCPVLSINIPLLSRENAPGSRTGPEDANHIHGMERGEKKVWIKVAVYQRMSAEIFFHGFSLEIAF